MTYLRDDERKELAIIPRLFAKWTLFAIELASADDGQAPDDLHQAFRLLCAEEAQAYAGLDRKKRDKLAGRVGGIATGLMEPYFSAIGRAEIAAERVTARLSGQARKIMLDRIAAAAEGKEGDAGANMGRILLQLTTLANMIGLERIAEDGPFSQAFEILSGATTTDEIDDLLNRADRSARRGAADMLRRLQDEAGLFRPVAVERAA